MTEDAVVDQVEIVLANNDRVTLRIGDVFLKIDADQTRTDVEVEAMAAVPVPTPEVLWRKPPALALAAVRGEALGRLAEPSSASPPAWAAAGAALRVLHDAPLPPWRGRPRGSSLRRAARRAPPPVAGEACRRPRTPLGRRVRLAPRQRRLPWRGGPPQPPLRRGCASALDTGVHARRPAHRARLR